MDTVIDRRAWWPAVAGLGAVAAVAVAGMLLRDVVPPADAWILDAWYVAGGTGAGIAAAVSGVGTLLAFGMLVAGLVGARRRRPGVVWRALVVAAASVSVLVLQGLVSRVGPPMQAEEGTYPSGHATLATALVCASFVAYAAWGRRWARAALVAGVVLVVLVSASRVVLAEHWLVDVAAGMIAATGMGVAAVTVLRAKSAG